MTARWKTTCGDGSRHAGTMPATCARRARARSGSRATWIGLAALVALSAHAADGSIESARLAREQARAELARAQEAFDRADEAYINALRGTAVAQPAARSATATPAVGSAAAAPAAAKRARVVTFTLAGPRAQMVNPLEYRGRLIVDGQPDAWTAHASGAKKTVSADVRDVAYEVQADERGDALNPAWKTICVGAVPSSGSPVIEVELAGQTHCTVR